MNLSEPPGQDPAIQQVAAALAASHPDSDPADQAARFAALTSELAADEPSAEHPDSATEPSPNCTGRLRRVAGRIVHEAGQSARVLLRGPMRSRWPNPLVVLWRWRYEAGALLLVSGVVVGLYRSERWWACGVVLGLVLTPVVFPKLRQGLFDRIRCVIVVHRVRTACTEALIFDSRGRLPVILLADPRPYGTRVVLWLRAGAQPARFEEARDRIAAACWAESVQISQSNHDHLIVLQVIRGRGHTGPIPQEAPPGKALVASTVLSRMLADR